MLIYKCIVTGDELFTDSYKVKLKDEVLYEVYGKHVVRKGGDFILEGANPSAEEPGECGADESVESGVDIILNQRLIETCVPDKKEFTKYLKEITKKQLEKVQEKCPDQLDSFKTNMQKVAKDLLGKFKDLQFFIGESMEPSGSMGILEYRDIDGEEIPIMMFLKYALDEEKY